MYDIKLCHGSRRTINLVAENAERFSTTVDSTSCSSIASRNLATANSIVHRTCHVQIGIYGVSRIPSRVLKDLAIIFHLTSSPFSLYTCT